MSSRQPTPAASIAELTRLRGQLEDLLAAFAAIRGGGVDAIMVGGPNDERLYTLTSADRPYRVIVEEMGEGAATVSERGVLLYVNRRLSNLIGRDRRDLIGTDVTAAGRSGRPSPADRPARRAGRPDQPRRTEPRRPRRRDRPRAHLGDRPGHRRGAGPLPGRRRSVQPPPPRPGNRRRQRRDRRALGRPGTSQHRTGPLQRGPGAIRLRGQPRPDRTIAHHHRVR